MFGPKIIHIAPGQVAEEMRGGKVQLVDVREPHEFAAGHIPGAVNIPLGSLAGRLGELDPSVETLMVCHSGNRSRTASKIAMRAGFADVRNVTGGTLAWKGPLER